MKHAVILLTALLLAPLTALHAADIRRNRMLYMFYAGSYDNTPQQVGVATSKDGVKWERLFREPFLRNGQPGEWNSSESAHPDIFDDGERSSLFFQGNPDKGNTWWLSNVEVFWKNIPHHEGSTE